MIKMDIILYQTYISIIKLYIAYVFIQVYYTIMYNFMYDVSIYHTAMLQNIYKQSIIIRIVSQVKSRWERNTLQEVY